MEVRYSFSSGSATNAANAVSVCAPIWRCKWPTMPCCTAAPHRRSAEGQASTAARNVGSRRSSITLCAQASSAHVSGESCGTACGAAFTLEPYRIST